AHGKHAGLIASQKTQPAILQHVGVLKLVDQNVFETALIMLANRGIAGQQLVGTQQQLAKVHYSFTFALLLIKLIKLDQASAVRVVRFQVARTLSIFFTGVDELLNFLGRKFLVINI